MNLRLFICENFGCADKDLAHSLIFKFKDDEFLISKCSVFKYQLLRNGTFLFKGSIKQLKTYLLCLKQHYKSNEFTLRNPEQIILPEIVDIFNGEMKDLRKYKSLVNSLSSEKEVLNKRISDYKSEIKKFNEDAHSKNEIIKSKNSEIANLKKDCQEAADLIEILYTQKEELDLGTKHYKLENFPKDVCDFIKDLIKEYYNKK